MLTAEEKMAKAMKKKYYEFTYEYIRYNPQFGSYTAKSTVIASTEKEAIKLAETACDGIIYGYNSFNKILSKGPELTYGKDYTLEEKWKKTSTGRCIGRLPMIAARKVY